MPDIVVHNAMGNRVLTELNTEISSLIDSDIFRFSVMGPDPYIFYRFFAPHFRHDVNKRSTIMHRTKCGEFLMELAKRSKKREMFSFTAGFLCHYAMDSTSHPFINDLAENKGDMHTAIEHKLDVMELERQGKKRSDIMDLFADFPDLPGVKEAMQKVYGWNDETYKLSYRHMKLFHWIVKDQHGVLNACLKRFPGKLSAISYSNNKCDNVDLSGFDALEEQAVAFGVDLITAMFEYCKGKISEERLKTIIGNKSYAGNAVTEII